VQRENLSSYLRIYDTATGLELACERIPKAWVTHVQFSPIDSNQVLYNHEWVVKESGHRRMWLWDGRRHIRLRPETESRSRFDWVCHEMWERDGSAVIYHGKYAEDGPAFVGRLDMASAQTSEIALAGGRKEYGHFTTGGPGVLISDGYYGDDETPPGDPSEPYSWCGKWISLLRVDWAKGAAAWVPLARSGSSWRTQDEHPHPIVDHACRHGYFTSDRTGHRAVYRIALPAL
jgi:oligogalacturonide lyase